MHKYENTLRLQMQSGPPLYMQEYERGIPDKVK